MRTLKVNVRSMFRSGYIPASRVNVSIAVEGHIGLAETAYMEDGYTDDDGCIEFRVQESCTVGIYVNNMLYTKTGVYYNDEAVSILL